MAKLIPSGVIQLPDFAELQYKLDRQKQADEMAVARDLAQYKRQTGQIAPGALPLVQSQFDAWQDAAKKYAADQSPTTLAELNSAYDSYAQAHGYARFLFDTVKERDAQYYSDPTKWNIKVNEYLSDSGKILNNKYASTDELISAASNIPSLSPAKKYDFGSADEWSANTLKSWDKVYEDLDTKGVGRISDEQRDTWFNDVFNHQIGSDNASKMNAILSEAKLRGVFGDGPITNDDINRVIANQELSSELLNSFYDRAKSKFDPAAKLTVVKRYEVLQDRARAARESGDGFGGTSVPKAYKNLTPIRPDKGVGFIYRIDNNTIKTSDGSDIVAFGVVDGIETVAVVPPKTGFEIEPPKPVLRPTTPADRANMKSEMLGAYESYIDKGEVSLPKSSAKQKGAKQSNNPLGLDL